MKKKKRLPKTECERLKKIKQAEKAKPPVHYDGIELDIKRHNYDPLMSCSDPLMSAIILHSIIKGRNTARLNKMWGPVLKK